MLKISNVSKSYAKNIVLENVKLDIKQGVFYTILGKNGEGKSTLMRLMAGLEQPGKGYIKLNGEDVSAYAFSQVGKVFLVHENVVLPVCKSFRKQVSFLSVHNEQWDESYFQYLISKTGININKPFISFSRGQKMQLMLAYGLASSPLVLILDEITAVMDLNARKFFLEELKGFVVKGGTAILSTNIVHEVANITDHVVVLNKKKVILNTLKKDIPKLFFKIRKTLNSDHPIFKEQNISWCHLNSDGSESFVAPIDLQLKYKEDLKSLIDLRKPTLEDIFCFLINSNEVNLEISA